MCGAGDPGLDTVWCAGVQGAGGGQMGAEGGRGQQCFKMRGRLHRVLSRENDMTSFSFTKEDPACRKVSRIARGQRDAKGWGGGLGGGEGCGAGEPRGASCVTGREEVRTLRNGWI